MPAHHGEGSLTGEMTPMVCIWSNSSSTFLRNGIGTLRAVCSAYGATPGLSFIVYSPPSVPKPLTDLGKTV